jgi:hypothetical protein
MIYYYKRLYDENGFTGKYSDVIETEFDFVPEGDGMGVDMNGIDYKEYIKNKDSYEITNGKLIKIPTPVKTGGGIHLF